MLLILSRRSGHADWRLSRDESGRPLAIDEHNICELVISVSHADSRLALACASDGKVGVDLERHRDQDFAGVAAYAFGPREQEAVRLGGSGTFYRIWTLREAFAKTDGAGLVSVTDRQDRFAEGPTEGLWHEQREGAAWHFAHYKIDRNYSLALAACGFDFTLRWRGADASGWAV